MATSRGIDVSAYQGAQDWAAHKRGGVAFAFAKASEGQRSRDTRFAMHIKGIIDAGLVPGAYHFAWPNQDARAEAGNYIDAVRPFAGRGFTHWLDLERYADGRNYRGRTAAQIRAWVTTWMDTVGRAFPTQRVGVYTSSSDLAVGHVPPGVPLWYPAYPWGAAPYGRAEEASRPSPSGRSPLIWQFTSQPLDRSICYLSAAELRAWAAGTTPEEDDPMAGMTKQDIADAVLNTDGVFDIPASWRTANPSNAQWKLSAVIVHIGERIRGLQAQLDAQTVTIDRLVTALTAGPADLEALRREIREAIEGVTVRLDVQDQQTPES
ncbi:glycoside hydrolase family 25 protein [Streptomyces sp. HD1123-B1]|uniref:glycoside hydrolase family 25 protein n=1 Tax=Streptomyces huangiella TaxID=3228804 RepID=UPI003D7D592E